MDNKHRYKKFFSRDNLKQPQNSGNHFTNNQNNQNNRNNKIWNNRNLQNNHKYNDINDANNNNPHIYNNRCLGDNNDDVQNNYLDQQHVKQQLVNFIYNTITISKFKYSLIAYENDLDMLAKTDYFVSPNYNGINSLLIFVKLRNNYYSFTIDRRTLTYNPSQLDLNSIKIIPINIRLDESIYNGTIIDGVVLYNNSRNKTFVINDIYVFRGQCLTDDKINDKMLNISMYLQANLTKDKFLKNITFVINKLYEPKDIQHLVNIYIPKSKYKNSIKGLAFYPTISGTKLIYLFNNCSNITPKKSLHDKTRKKIITIRPSGFNNTDGITAIFRIKKTKTPDVYHLYLSKKMIKNGKKIIKFKKYGIAYIPTFNVSYFCKDLFNSIDDNATLVKCKYSCEKNKWIPFEHTKDKKIPDNIKNVNKLFEEIEIDESCEEHDLSADK
jgi:hypothetical protein